MLYDISANAAQIKALADWACDGKTMAEILLRRDGQWLCAEQGDDFCAWGPDGKEAPAGYYPEDQARGERVPAKVIDGVVHCGECGGTQFRYDESHPSARTQSSNEGMKLVFHGDFEWYDGDDTPGVICASCETIADVPSGVSVDFD